MNQAVMDHWTTVKRIHQSALDIDPSERAAFLNESCGSDETLRREVESLLTYATEAESFLERPAVDIAPTPPGESHEATLVGRTISHYQVAVVARCRRNGRGLPRARSATGPDRRAENPARRARGGRGPHATLHARSEGRIRAEPSECGHHLRRRRERWHLLHRHGARRRRDPSGEDQPSNDTARGCRYRRAGRGRVGSSPTRRASRTVTSSQPT